MRVRAPRSGVLPAATRQDEKGRRAWQEGPEEVSIKPLADDGEAGATFNRETIPMQVDIDFAGLSLPRTVQARGLWTRQNLGSSSGR